jgi:hypothetical protein
VGNVAWLGSQRVADGGRVNMSPEYGHELFSLGEPGGLAVVVNWTHDATARPWRAARSAAAAARRSVRDIIETGTAGGEADTAASHNP